MDVTASAVLPTFPGTLSMARSSRVLVWAAALACSATIALSQERQASKLSEADLASVLQRFKAHEQSAAATEWEWSTGRGLPKPTEQPVYWGRLLVDNDNRLLLRYDQQTKTPTTAALLDGVMRVRRPAVRLSKVRIEREILETCGPHSEFFASLWHPDQLLHCYMGKPVSNLIASASAVYQLNRVDRDPADYRTFLVTKESEAGETPQCLLIVDYSTMLVMKAASYKPIEDGEGRKVDSVTRNHTDYVEVVAGGQAYRQGLTVTVAETAKNGHITYPTLTTLSVLDPPESRPTWVRATLVSVPQEGIDRHKFELPPRPGEMVRNVATGEESIWGGGGEPIPIAELNRIALCLQRDTGFNSAEEPAATQSESKDTGETRAMPMSCGQVATYTLLKGCGVNVSPESVTQLLGSDPTTALNLLQLKLALETCGMKCQAFKGSIRDFVRGDTAKPVLLRMTRKEGVGNVGHFVVALRRGSNLSLYEPPQGVAMVDVGTLEQAFVSAVEWLEISDRQQDSSAIGLPTMLMAALAALAVLIVWKRRMSNVALLLLFLTAPVGCKPAEGSAMRVLGTSSVTVEEGLAVVTGPAGTGESRTAEFHLQNTGSTPVVLDRVIPSCGCSSAKVDPVRLGPGERGILSVTIKVRGTTGELVSVAVGTEVSKKLFGTVQIRVPPAERNIVTLDPASAVIDDSRDANCILYLARCTVDSPKPVVLTCPPRIAVIFGEPRVSGTDWANITWPVRVRLKDAAQDNQADAGRGHVVLGFEGLGGTADLEVEIEGKKPLRARPTGVFFEREATEFSVDMVGQADGEMYVESCVAGCVAVAKDGKVLIRKSAGAERFFEGEVVVRQGSARTVIAVGGTR